MNYVAFYIYGDYLYGCINESGDFEEMRELTYKFPTVDANQLEIVKQANIPNLGYRQEGEEFILFDKTKEQYIKYDLPVYTKVFDKLTLTNRTKTLSVPTKETIEAIQAICELLNIEFFKFTHKEEIEKLYDVINKGNGIACINHSEFPYLNPIIYHCGDLIRLFNHQYDIYIIGIEKNDPNLKLTLKVPESLVGKVIGKGGKNIKEMAKKLGVMQIAVASI